jgi:transglutaminase-like putative cysteine protease
MNLPRTFLALTFLLVFIGIAAHELAAEQYVFLLVTPVLLAAAWHFEAAGRPLRISEGLATLLTAAAFFLVMFQGIDRSALMEFGMFDVQVSTVGKFLIAFEWISIFREKRARDYAWVYLVTVVLMGIAGLLMPSLAYGALLLLYALVGIAALTVFHLWARASAAGADLEHEVKVSYTLLLSAVPMVLALLPPLAGIFMALPRHDIRFSSRFAMARAQPVAGFSDTVRLGEVGTIQDNPQRVMTVVIRNPETGKPMDVADLLLRGVVLEKYVLDNDRWTWRTELMDRRDWARSEGREGDVTRFYRITFPEFDDLPYQLVRFDIDVETIASPVLFTVFAPEKIILPGDRAGVDGNPFLHIFRRRQSSYSPYMYTVHSRLLRSYPQDVPPIPPAEFDYLQLYLEVPQEISPRVVALAREVAPAALTPEERARRLYNYLSDPNRFAYTLNMAPTPGVEPVEDFLFNRHVGHCEYFASAMALMLRCVGVPSRIVNGFKVWEYSALGEHYIVRQSNAHSWVEAYVPPDGWRTYDPSVQRDAVTDRGAPKRVWVRNLYGALDDYWVRYVINYSRENQHALSAVLQRGASRLRRFWMEMFATVAGDLFNDRIDVWRTVFSFLRAPLRLAGLFGVFFGGAFALYHVLRQAARLWRERETRASIRYYRRMEDLLARRGRRRRRSQTPWEFHHDLAEQDWPEVDSVALVTECFCRARYAAAALDPEELREVRAALRRIAHARRRTRR